MITAVAFRSIAPRIIRRALTARELFGMDINNPNDLWIKELHGSIWSVSHGHDTRDEQGTVVLYLTAAPARMTNIELVDDYQFSTDGVNFKPAYKHIDERGNTVRVFKGV